jgi:hypothetical protein
LDILTMHLPINVKSPNNISKWQMEFNAAFKGLKSSPCSECRMLFLGNSPVSEFYMPTFRNTLFQLHRQVGMNND